MQPNNIDFFGVFQRIHTDLQSPTVTPLFFACLAIAIIHIAFSIGVFVQRPAGGTFFVPRFFWALATLVMGIPIVVVYWVIHYSTLRSTSDSAPLN